MYIEGNNQTGGPIWNYATGTNQQPGRGAKVDLIIQLNCGGQCTHVSYKTEVEITDFQMPDKTSGTIKDLSDILKIPQTPCLGSRVQTSPTFLAAKMYYGNFWSA